MHPQINTNINRHLRIMDACSPSCRNRIASVLLLRTSSDKDKVKAVKRLRARPLPSSKRMAAAAVAMAAVILRRRAVCGSH